MPDLILTPADISVVVQGGVSSQTTATLASVRRHLPGAELILSTWHGTAVEQLDADVKICLPDPGADGLIRRFPFPHAHNVNRQLISTLAGYRASTRDYCLKIRTDMEVRSNAFLDLYGTFSQIGTDGFFSQRILVEGLTTSLLAPFAIGDWWLFGRRSDLYDFYDVAPYVSEAVDGLEYLEQPDNEKLRPFLGDIICRLPPEHYIASKFLEKHRKFRFRHFYDFNPNAMAASHQFILHNFITAEPELTGLLLPKAANTHSPANYRNGLPLQTWYAATAETGRRAVSEEKLASLTRSSFRSAMIDAYESYPAFENKRAELSVLQNYTRNSALVVPAPGADVRVREEDVTFVVAGKLDEKAQHRGSDALRSIRTFFPSAKIVLSTWDDFDASELEGLYDAIVTSPAPDLLGEVYLHDSPLRKANTTALQQLLMARGLDLVETDYAVRFRPDFSLTNATLLDFYNYWASTLRATRREFQLFSSRMLTLRVITSNPRRTGGHFVHQLSDLFQLGRTEHLKQLWTGEPMLDSDAEYFENNPDSRFVNVAQFNHRYTSEQFPWLRLLSRAKPEIRQPEFYWDNASDRLSFETEAMFAANVIVASQRQLGLTSKFDEERDFKSDHFYIFADFLELYLRFVDPHDEVVLSHFWLSFHLQTLARPARARGFRTLRAALGYIEDIGKSVDLEALSRWQMPHPAHNRYLALKAHPTRFYLDLAPRYLRGMLVHSVLKTGMAVKRVMPLIARRAVRWGSNRAIQVLTLVRDRIV